MPRRLTYGEIADDLADRIAIGEYPPGARLPSYAQLMALYDVSRSTVHRAMQILHERGVVYGEQGRGVYPAEPGE